MCMCVSLLNPMDYCREAYVKDNAFDSLLLSLPRPLSLSLLLCSQRRRHFKSKRRHKLQGFHFVFILS